MHEHHQADNSIKSIPPERQARCPVTGDMVDMHEAENAGHVRDYGGKRYYFCCATCVQMFDKNPEEYTK